MPRLCSICTHPERETINQVLLAGEPYRHIAARFDTSTGALQRHRSDHLPVELVKAQEVQEVVQADSLLDQVKDLQSKALSILGKAVAAGDLRTCVIAIREGSARSKLKGGVSGYRSEQRR